MAGTFEGLSDLEWKLFADLFPAEPMKRGRGMPHTPLLKVIKTLLYGLITGCRWGDLPRGRPWASKSAAHRWLQRWQADGPLAVMQGRLLGLAAEPGMMQWRYGAVDSSFSPGKGGGEGVAYGRRRGSGPTFPNGRGRPGGRAGAQFEKMPFACKPSERVRGSRGSIAAWSSAGNGSPPASMPFSRSP